MRILPRLASLWNRLFRKEVLDGELDDDTYAASLALISSGSALACWIPAHRAIAISPMDALRTE